MSTTMQEFTGGELVKLVTSKWIGKVIVGFEDALHFSFQTDGLIKPGLTHNEIERRFKILVKWFVTLRRELHWSVPRILDELPMILRKELDGVKYEPDEERSAWRAQGGPDELEPAGEDMADPVPEDVKGIEVEGL